MRTFLERPIALLCTLYTLAWFPILFQKGIYWDAWMWIPEMFTYRNFEWMYVNEFAPLRAEHYYLIFRPLADTSDPIFIAHSIIFFSWLGSGLLLFRILDRQLLLSTRTALILSAYYLLFPAFITRFEIVSGTYYSTANLAFMLASYLYLSPLAQRRSVAILREVIALPLFVWSFLCNSFPVFFFGFVAIHIYRFAILNRHETLRTALTAWLKRFFYLPLLSFAYVAIKLFVLKPYGIGEHYNELLISRDMSLVQMISQFVDSFWGGLWAGFFWPLAASLNLLDRKYFVLLLVITLAIVYALIKKVYRIPDVAPLPRHTFEKFISQHATYAPFVLAAGFLFLALFPYAMAGKAPHIYGYGFALRLSLLFPLGSAILLFGAITVFLTERFRVYAHIVLLSLFVSFIWYNSFLQDMDWYKQQAILHELPKVVREISPPATFVFYDDTRGFNWIGRTIADQEYSGYFHELTGSKEYRGVNYFDWGKEKGTDATAIIRITSLRPDEPRVSDWLYLKATEFTSSKEQLRNAAHERLQIQLVREEVTQTAF